MLLLAGGAVAAQVVRALPSTPGSSEFIPFAPVVFGLPLLLAGIWTLLPGDRGSNARYLPGLVVGVSVGAWMGWAAHEGSNATVHEAVIAIQLVAVIGAGLLARAWWLAVRPPA